MKQLLFALAGLGTIAGTPSAAIAQDTEARHLGVARFFVRSILKPFVAWRPLLCPANDQTDQGHGKTGFLMAHLPRGKVWQTRISALRGLSIWFQGSQQYE